MVDISWAQILSSSLELMPFYVQFKDFKTNILEGYVSIQRVGGGALFFTPDEGDLDYFRPLGKEAVFI